MALTLRYYDDLLSMCLLDQAAPAPINILAHSMTYFMRTRDETTLICPTTLVPNNVLKQEDGWIAIEFVGPFTFGETGILAQVANPLAAAGIAIIALATFGTDYILIKADKREAAIDALRKAGHIIQFT